MRGMGGTAISFEVAAIWLIVGVATVAWTTKANATGMTIYEPASDVKWNLGELYFVGKNISWFIDSPSSDDAEIVYDVYSLTCDTTGDGSPNSEWDVTLDDCDTPQKVNETHYFCTVSRDVANRDKTGNNCRVNLGGSRVNALMRMEAMSADFSIVHPEMRVLTPEAGTQISLTNTSTITANFTFGEYAMAPEGFGLRTGWRGRLYELPNPEDRTPGDLGRYVTFASSITYNQATGTGSANLRINGVKIRSENASYYIRISTTLAGPDFYSDSGEFIITKAASPPSPPAPAPAPPASASTINGWVDCVNQDCDNKFLQCTGDKCSVSCGPNGCQDSRFVCPVGSVCRFNCDSPGSCARSQFLCNGVCSVSCPGFAACANVIVGPTSYPLDCTKDGSSCEICAPFNACLEKAKETSKQWTWWYILVLVFGCIGIVVGIGVGCCIYRRRRSTTEDPDGTKKKMKETTNVVSNPLSVVKVGGGDVPL